MKRIEALHEAPKPEDPYITPHFKRLSSSRQRKMRRGVVLGYVTKEEIRDEKTLSQLDDDSAAAQHEVYHDAALIGLEKKGVQRLGMTINRTSEYRAVTFFAMNSKIPLETSSWIILVTAAASGAPDIFDYGYTHIGRESDEAQFEGAANVLSFSPSSGSIRSQGRSEATGFVKAYASEHRIWTLTRRKAA